MAKKKKKFADFMIGKRLLCLLVIVGLVMFALVTAFGGQLSEAIRLMTSYYRLDNLGMKGPFSIEPVKRLWEFFWEAFIQAGENPVPDYPTEFAIDKGTIIGFKLGSLLSLGFCMLLTAIFPKMRSRLCFVGALFVISVVNMFVALNANTYVWGAFFKSLPFVENDPMVSGSFYGGSFFCALRDSQAFGWLWIGNLTAIVNCLFGRTLSKIKGVGKGIYLLPFICAVLALLTYFCDSWMFSLRLPQADGVYFLLIVGFYAIFCTQILKVVELPEKTVAFNLVWHILLLLFSHGIWDMFWAFRTTRYLNKEESLKKRKLFLETILFVLISPYRIWWIFRTSALVDQLAKENGVKSNLKILCLILAFFLPIVPMILLQIKLNQIVKARGQEESEEVVEKEFTEETTVEEIAQEAMNELVEEASGLVEDVGEESGLADLISSAKTEEVEV